MEQAAAEQMVSLEAE
jgi:hypothetical protein